MMREAGKQKLPRTRDGMKRRVPVASKAGRRNLGVRNEMFSQVEKIAPRASSRHTYDLVNDH